ncbi:MAG: PAS domain S-box protein [Acholeplasmatales bacterium]|nr:PAS domain S-box protein [Acholeplasmatales bacterium]
MRKKYIFINTVILFVSLIIFLITSISIVYYLNERNTNNSIRNYLSIVEASYDGTNMDTVASRIHTSNKDVRITFISSDGQVLYDTSKVSEENHLDRPEIKNLGTIAKRYSNTTNKKMYYLASYDTDSNVYVRVSIPEASVSDVVTKYAYYSIFGALILSIASFGIIYLASKKLVKPLKEEIVNLSNITNNELSYDGDDIVELSHQIEGVRKIIDKNIRDIKYETLKLNYIIDNMNNGVIIISGDDKIILINNLAIDILNDNKENIIDKNYQDVFKDFNIENEIVDTMNNDYKYETIYKKNGRIYAVSIASLFATFVIKGNKHGVAIFIRDITEAKMLEQVKLDFFANASHELKSPLTTIIGYQQMISEGIITEESEIKEATSKTIKEATRMNQIIIQMLELSKLEMETDVEKKELSIINAIDGVLESLDVLLQNKNIKVIKNFEDFNVFMNMDELYHIIRNLIENSVKYNKENGTITITLEKDNKMLSIKDSGIGISKENQSRIFERFYRVDKAKSKDLGGNGLGLAIVKHICMNNNISIEVKSELNEYTEFILKFNDK